MTSALVTIFGGSGFLGRHIVKRMAAEGWRVRIAVRRPERATDLKRFGRDDQIACVSADVWDEETVARAVSRSAWVVNMVGHYVRCGAATITARDGQGALHVARQAERAGVERLVHISALGADPAAESPFARARGIGEMLVRDAFDGVTILRPSVIFGRGDAFLGRLADLARRTPVLPLFGNGGTKLQPVSVDDVAEACARVLAEPSTSGRVYELGGPCVHTYSELLTLLFRVIGRSPVLLPVPFFVWDVLAILTARLANPPVSRDLVRQMKRDQVVARGASSLADLGIEPASLERSLPACLAP